MATKRCSAISRLSRDYTKGSDVNLTFSLSTVILDLCATSKTNCSLDMLIAMIYQTTAPRHRSRSLLQTNGANAVKQEISILTQDVRDTGDGDFVVVHQHPLE